ncbi:hypothetical protein MKY34_14425 [Sporosarcina sp. FSL K6-1522]|uniref:hypothetical protein n=1 Tax=Sporosarcina sp. FSL K6-1522 TaxID=2921554 RepID=UPI003159C459
MRTSIRAFFFFTQNKEAINIDALIIGAAGVFGVIFGIAINYFTFNQNRDKDVKEDAAAEKAVVRTKFDHIVIGVDNIRGNVKAQEKSTRTSFVDLNKEFVQFDESTNISAFEAVLIA